MQRTFGDAEHLSRRNLLLPTGTMVDAAIIAETSSTKNRERKRDAETPQARKGNPGYFGLKAQIRVDNTRGLVHTVMSPAAHVADVSETHRQLYGGEQAVYADSGYTVEHPFHDIKVQFGHRKVRLRGACQEHRAAADVRLRYRISGWRDEELLATTT